MYKNQLQELAQRSCFNLPSYTCIREGPDHAPRFKATVNFNGESFESPQYCSTLRQAEHSAAEVALNALSCHGPSNSLAAKILRCIRANYKCLLKGAACIREVPDHAPRFKAIVNFNGEIFYSPNFCSEAEHSAAEVALKAFASRGSSNSLAARILDETGVYKNLLQEVSQRVGASLPVYETFRSGLGHQPIFTCTVELAGIIFTGDPAKNKKQAEKNAAMAAWTSLKLMVQQSENSTPEKVKNDEQEHVTVVRALQKYLLEARMANETFPIRFPTQNAKPASTTQPSATSSRILPFICPRPGRNRPTMTAANTGSITSKVSPQNSSMPTTVNEMKIYPKITQCQPTSTAVNDCLLPTESPQVGPQKFPAAGAAPYIPIGHCSPHHRIAPPVTIRNVIPVYSSPPIPPPSQSSWLTRPPSPAIAPPGCLRQAIPGYSAPSVRLEQLSLLDSTIGVEEPPFSKPPPVKFEEALSFKVPQAQENPSSTKTMPGGAEELLLSNASAVPVEFLSDSDSTQF